MAWACGACTGQACRVSLVRFTRSCVYKAFPVTCNPADSCEISNPTLGLIGRSASGPCALLICQTSWKTRAGSGVVPLFWAKNFRSDAPSIALRYAALAR